MSYLLATLHPFAHMFHKTPEHLAIENSVQSRKHTIVAAGPGSGKTTTISQVIVPALLVSNHNLSGIQGGAVAFNTKNANGLKVAINSPYVECGTVHSIGLRCLKTVVNGLKIEVPNKGGFYKGRYIKPTVDKMVRLADQLFPSKEGEKLDFTLPLRLVNLMKANAFGIPGYPAINDRQAINELLAHHALVSDDTENNGERLEQAIDVAIKLMQASVKEYAVANYDDMLYMALALNARLPDWKFLVYDEGQDIKPIEFELIRRMAENGTQIIVVGDSYQAVNQFTGCMADSLASLASLLNVSPLPLRTSYRASIAAADLANAIFPNSVIPWSGAKQGSVETISFSEVSEMVSQMDFNSGILSRTHKNLIGMALKLLSQKKAFTYKGISELVQRMNRMLWHASKLSKELGSIRQNLTEYQAMLEDKHVKPNGSLPAWVTTNGETTEALCLLLAQCEGQGETLECTKEYLNTLADMEKPSSGPTLSTSHSAKGLQWENVYLVGPMQSNLAKSEQQLFAEKCLEYVAVSRSSDKVIIVEV